MHVKCLVCRAGSDGRCNTNALIRPCFPRLNPTASGRRKKLGASIFNAVGPVAGTLAVGAVGVAAKHSGKGIASEAMKKLAHKGHRRADRIVYGPELVTRLRVTGPRGRNFLSTYGEDPSDRIMFEVHASAIAVPARRVSRRLASRL